MNLQIGSLVSFSYKSARSHDPYPEVLVLHPGWRKGNTLCLHGLNFNYLTDDEINLVRMIVDPSFQLQYFQAMEAKNPGIAAEFDRIIARAGAANITSPLDFYQRAIRPFIQPRGWNPYRLYDVSKLQSVRVLQSMQTMTGVAKRAWYQKQQQAMRSKGKNEAQIIMDLAAKKAEEEKTGKKILVPAEVQMIARLQGDSQQLFQKYKTKFRYAKGPMFNNNIGKLPGNNFTNRPKFMEPDEDDDGFL